MGGHSNRLEAITSRLVSRETTLAVGSQRYRKVEAITTRLGALATKLEATRLKTQNKPQCWKPSLVGLRPSQQGRRPSLQGSRPTRLKTRIFEKGWVAASSSSTRDLRGWTTRIGRKRNKRGWDRSFQRKAEPSDQNASGIK